MAQFSSCLVLHSTDDPWRSTEVAPIILPFFSLMCYLRSRMHKWHASTRVAALARLLWSSLFQNALILFRLCYLSASPQCQGQGSDSGWWCHSAYCTWRGPTSRMQCSWSMPASILSQPVEQHAWEIWGTTKLCADCSAQLTSCHRIQQGPQTCFPRESSVQTAGYTNAMQERYSMFVCCFLLHYWALHKKSRKRKIGTTLLLLELQNSATSDVACVHNSSSRK